MNESAQLLDRAMQIARDASGDGSTRTAYVLLAQAELQRSQHRKSEAKQLTSAAKAILAAHSRDNQLGQTVEAGLLRTTAR